MGHPNYYSRFGFVPSVNYGITSEYDVPEEVFMIKEIQEGIRAMDMEEYYLKLKETALEGFKRINETEQVEDKNLTFPAGSLDISVVRGAVLEKAATSRIQLKTKNPATG